MWIEGTNSVMWCEAKGSFTEPNVEHFEDEIFLSGPPQIGPLFFKAQDAHVLIILHMVTFGQHHVSVSSEHHKNALARISEFPSFGSMEGKNMYLFTLIYM